MERCIFQLVCQQNFILKKVCPKTKRVYYYFEIVKKPTKNPIKLAALLKYALPRWLLLHISVQWMPVFKTILKIKQKCLKAKVIWKDHHKRQTKMVLNEHPKIKQKWV